LTLSRGVHYTRPMPGLRFSPLLLAAALCAPALAGCSLDSRDLAAFQHSASGPEKLRAILESRDRAGPLRAEAALRLLDLQRTDVDGRGLLFAELNRLDAASKRAILPALKDGLSVRMHTPRGQAPSATAIRAKDAGAKLLSLLATQERALLGNELLHVLAEDVPRRANMGELSLEQIADKIGPESAKTLVSELDGKLDAGSLARLSALIDKHADAAQRALAASRLVELERNYRARQGDDSTALAQDLKARVLPSLGRFTDQPSVRARFIEIASTDSIEPSQRHYALELLASRCTESELTPLLALAQQETAPAELRVLALSRAGEVGNRRALPVMLILLTDRKNHALRRRAGELSLALGGTEAALSFFRNLPTGWGMNYSKQEIDAYVEQLATLRADTQLLLLLGEKLHSSFWWNRVMALRYFASRGTAEDIWRIRQHVHDLIPIIAPGYPRGHSVGLEAESALAMAIERAHADNPKARAWALQAHLGDAGVQAPAQAPVPATKSVVTGAGEEGL
jgi:hypothetical protein